MLVVQAHSSVTPAFRSMRQDKQKFQAIVRTCIREGKKKATWVWSACNHSTWRVKAGQLGYILLQIKREIQVGV